MRGTTLSSSKPLAYSCVTIERLLLGDVLPDQQGSRDRQFPGTAAIGNPDQAPRSWGPYRTSSAVNFGSPQSNFKRSWR